METNRNINVQDATDPLRVLSLWFEEHYSGSKLKHPAACVLSTIGLDGFPNARTVVLKEIRHPHLIITGPTNSRKGIEIASNPRVSLTFWWEESLRQIRIQGRATQIEDATADFYFSKRNKESQAVSSISDQGSILISEEYFRDELRGFLKRSKANPIPRPSNWAGYQIEIARIEFFKFKDDRNHFRMLFSKTGTGWKRSLLQP